MSYKTTWMLLALGIAVAGCAQKHDDPPPRLDPNVADEPVTEKNYLSGTAFCETYKKPVASFRGTGVEYGKRVEIPRDYSNPESGTWAIYTWTSAPFDPRKPSFVLLDGGPGGNSHGNDRLSDARFNEIHFDQRGLGCSAPKTFAEYSDPTNFSSENTIRDMEAVRKSYGISKWTPYGASYGTVLATMYAHKYPDQVSTVILDGTLFAHSANKWIWEKDKLNAMLGQLTPGQREGFRQFMSTGSVFNRQAVMEIADALKYYNDGYDTLLKLFQAAFDAQNRFSPATFAKYFVLIHQQKNSWGHPQAPGNTDNNVLIKIYCKELNVEVGNRNSPSYSTIFGTFGLDDEEARSPGLTARQCAKYGVNEIPSHFYVASDYPITRPTTYFQGTDDGATVLEDALMHWRQVARGQKSFFMRKRGGHCVNALALMDEKSAIKSSQMELFARAVLGQDFSRRDFGPELTILKSANVPLSSNDEWRFYNDLIGSNRPEDDVGI